MATHYSSGQYEDAYSSKSLQSWSRPRVYKQASPWGTYMGTWDMPLRIPPAKVSLTSRSVVAAAHLTDWINKSKALGDACNGLVPEITGKPSDPKETSAKAVCPSSKGEHCPNLADKMPAHGEIKYSGAATLEGPLSRQPGRIDVRLKEDGSLDVEETKEVKHRSASEIPLSRQPGSMDVRLKDTTPTPKAPALSRCNSREPTPRRATSAETPPSSRPRSLEGKPKGVSTPELLAEYCPGSMEANHKNGPLPEAMASSRPTTKGSQASVVQKAPTEGDVEEDLSESPQREGSARPPACPEHPSEGQIKNSITND